LVFQRFFIIGVVGAIGLVSGCSSWPSSTVEKTPTGTAEERPQATTDLTSAVKADKTKQVTIAVTGMT
jgi:hypothetical protein